MTASIMIWFYTFDGYTISGLKKINAMYSKIMFEKLPNSYDWLYDLEYIDIVKIDDSIGVKKFYDCYIETLSSYFVTGIKIGSEKYYEAKYILLENKISLDFLVPNDLLDAYLRIPFLIKNDE